MFKTDLLYKWAKKRDIPTFTKVKAFTFKPFESKVKYFCYEILSGIFNWNTCKKKVDLLSVDKTFSWPDFQVASVIDYIDISHHYISKNQL